MIITNTWNSLAVSALYMNTNTNMNTTQKYITTHWHCRREQTKKKNADLFHYILKWPAADVSSGGTNHFRCYFHSQKTLRTQFQHNWIATEQCKLPFSKVWWWHSSLSCRCSTMARSIRVRYSSEEFIHKDKQITRWTKKNVFTCSAPRQTCI